MKIANINRESLHFFWTTWEMLMTFSWKMWLKKKRKKKKKTEFLFFKSKFFFSLEDTFLEKPQRGERGVNWPPSLFRVSHLMENKFGPAFKTDTLSVSVSVPVSVSLSLSRIPFSIVETTKSKRYVTVPFTRIKD